MTTRDAPGTTLGTDRSAPHAPEARALRVVGLFPAFDPRVNEIAMVWRALARDGRIEARVLAGSSDLLKGTRAGANDERMPGLSIRRHACVERLHRDAPELMRWAADLRPDAIVAGTEAAVAPAQALRAATGAPVLLFVEQWFDPDLLRRREYLGLPPLRELGQRLHRARFERRLERVAVMNPRERERAEQDPSGRYAYVPWPHPPVDGLVPVGRGVRDLGRVVYVGALARWKGAAVLARSIDRLLSIEAQARVTIIGPATDDAGRVALAQLARWGEARCRIVDRLPREEAVAAIRGALCVYNPSGTHSWGLIGDAWNVGTPVISSGACHDLVDGENALVAPGPDAFVAAWRTLRSDAARWDALSLAGLARVRDGHSVAASGDAMLRAMSETARLHPAGVPA